jgi:hypothetical protein
MKAFLLMFISVLAFPVSPMQEINLEGTWSIVECVNGGPDGSQKVLEAEIKSGAAVCDFFFMKDGKFKQTSNMGDHSDNPKMSTQEGTWKLTGDKLIVSITYEGRIFDLDYACEYINETLVLTRKSPDGKFFVVNSFRKK